MTQIVICQPVYPSPLDQQNLFQPSVTPDSPSPSPIYSHKAYSNKPKGAFKLFKLKKAKKTDQQNLAPEALLPADVLEPKIFFKLKSRSLIIGAPRNNQIFSQASEPSCGYYDPNIAPLHFCNSSQPEEERTHGLGSIEKIDIFPLEDKRIIVQKRSQQFIQILDEEPVQFPQFQYQQEEPQLGDPFIIMKKVQIKQAKLKKMMGNIVKLPKKSKENMNQIIQNSSVSSLHDTKFKEIETPSVKSKEECFLQETQKSEHQKYEEIILGTGTVKTMEKNSKKRTQCSISDLSDYHSQYHFFLEDQNLARNIFGSPVKKIKSEDQ